MHNARLPYAKLPMLCIAYVVIYIVDVARNPTFTATATVIASDGNDDGSSVPILCSAPEGCWFFNQVTASTAGNARTRCARGLIECGVVAAGEVFQATTCYTFTLTDGIYVGFANSTNGNTASILSGKDLIPQTFAAPALASTTTRSLARASTQDNSGVWAGHTYHSYWVAGTLSAARTFGESKAAATAACESVDFGAVNAFAQFKGAAIIYETTINSRVIYSFPAIGGFFSLVIAMFGLVATGWRAIRVLFCPLSQSEIDEESACEKQRSRKAAAASSARRGRQVSEVEYDYVTDDDL